MRKALLGEEDTRQSWRGLRGSCVEDITKLG